MEQLYCYLTLFLLFELISYQLIIIISIDIIDNNWSEIVSVNLSFSNFSLQVKSLCLKNIQLIHDCSSLLDCNSVIFQKQKHNLFGPGNFNHFAIYVKTAFVPINYLSFYLLAFLIIFMLQFLHCVRN